MPDFHRRVLTVALKVCDEHRLVLAGGYAMRAHGLVERPSQDLDFATFDAPSIPAATRAMAEAFRRHGLAAEEVRGTPLLGRLIVTDPVTEQSMAVDLMKEPLQKAPVHKHDIPVASLEDMVGMKVAALNGRNVPRDLIDVASVREFYSFTTLERLGSVFDDDFNLIRLVDRLETAIETDERVFRQYGLSHDRIECIRQFALDWYNDLSLRLAGDEIAD
ncbi:nucleotidyl transferase AbiEii/AbiGii toxin family protein [Herbidospora sp. NBRC 101105]|uniref:nucleotidyl transferase AbiEii/AbiGii toxin family protein n=1 Tax=Herbidospora sp. NBRC 101105 TaxID=3032195 RepID=UPI002553EE9B|nr:nucleotidyl transferase AbiEii/AbiGii toxin family protein [Herbidospora sp. NBRC 101105]